MNPDVRAQRLDPLDHYLRFGADEGRDPGPGFCTKYYIASNPDVARSALPPLIHYILYGKRQGRRPAPGYLPCDGAKSFDPRSRTECRIEVGLKRFLDSPHLAPQNELRPTHVLITSFTEAEDPLLTAAATAACIAAATASPERVLIFADLQTDPDRIHICTSPPPIHIAALAPHCCADEECELLYRLVELLNPKLVHNVDSPACWRLFEARGAEMALKRQLVATVSTRETSKLTVVGQSLRTTWPQLSALIVSNTHTADTLADLAAISVTHRSFIHALRHASLPPEANSGTESSFSPTLTAVLGQIPAYLSSLR